MNEFKKKYIMKQFTEKDKETFLGMIKDGIFFEFDSLENVEILDILLSEEVDNILSMSNVPLKTLLIGVLDMRAWHNKQDIIREIDYLL